MLLVLPQGASGIALWTFLAFLEPWDKIASESARFSLEYEGYIDCYCVPTRCIMIVLSTLL